MSEARRYAALLTATRERPFNGRHPPSACRERLVAALPLDKVTFDADRLVIRASSVVYEGSLVADGEGSRLEGRFVPKASTRPMLMGLSILLALMMLASAVSLMQDGGAARYAIPGVTTIAALFFMPLLIFGLGSAREGDEARLERAMRVALEDLDPKMPQPQKWKDEE
jgi:hypothetical protein